MALKETLIGAVTGLVLGVGSSMIANVWWSRMTREFSDTLQNINRSLEEKTASLQAQHQADVSQMLRLHQELQRLETEGYLQTKEEKKNHSRRLIAAAAKVADDLSKIPRSIWFSNWLRKIGIVHIACHIIGHFLKITRGGH